MSKRKSWLNLVKRLFVSEAHSKLDKKEKKRRWLFQRPKLKRLPAPPRKDTATHNGAAAAASGEQDQSKHAVTVPISTSSVPAEAAIASADELVRFNSTTESAPRHFFPMYDSSHPPQSGQHQQYGKPVQDLAAIRIQTAFRGFLARKALRALRGLVKLQAIIRGRVVRRQAIITLKRLQSIVNIQSQVAARRSQEDNRGCEEPKVSTESNGKVESNSHRRWDDSLLTKEEANYLLLSKRKALIKRERIKEYSYSHRRSTEPEHNNNNINEKLRFLLEKWVDTQLSTRSDMEDLGLMLPASTNAKESGEKNPTLVKNYSARRNKQYRLEGLVSPISVPRRSLQHRKRPSLDGDNAVVGGGGSPVVPTYMAATESAKAKLRSLSSPKLRPPGSFDSYSDSNSPYKNKQLCPVVSDMSMNSDVKINYKQQQQQRSPRVKGVIDGPAKSINRSTLTKDLSIDSDCSALTWDPHYVFRKTAIL